MIHPDSFSNKHSIYSLMQLYDHILGSLGIKLATARGRACTEGKLTKTAYGLMYTVKVGVGH